MGIRYFSWKSYSLANIAKNTKFGLSIDSEGNPSFGLNINFGKIFSFQTGVTMNTVQFLNILTNKGLERAVLWGRIQRLCTAAYPDYDHPACVVLDANSRRLINNRGENEKTIFL